jgi:hypothetical protein
MSHTVSERETINCFFLLGGDLSGGFMSGVPRPAVNREQIDESADREFCGSSWLFANVEHCA